LEQFMCSFEAACGAATVVVVAAVAMAPSHIEPQLRMKILK
jgi:hypothetical protein